jgi:hypothetical protein
MVGRDWVLDGPAVGSAKEGCGGETGEPRPVGHVETGARVNLLRRGGMVLLRKCINNMASGRFLLGAGGAGPVDEEALTTDLATYIADGVGDFTENLHFSGPF